MIKRITVITLLALALLGFATQHLNGHVYHYQSGPFTDYSGNVHEDNGIVVGVATLEAGYEFGTQSGLFLCQGDKDSSGHYWPNPLADWFPAWEVDC